MADLYNFRYRIPSARAKWWNYGNNGAYFITICTLHRKHYFGEIARGEMHLSSAGMQCWECWLQIPQHFPFVVLDAFVVMPNHIHGIIIIDKTIKNFPVEAQNFAPLQGTAHKGNQFGPQSQNLGSVIRGLKIGATIFCRQNGIEFGWQARYHDHIIRDQYELERIQRYILNNPKNWQEDIHHC